LSSVFSSTFSFFPVHFCPPLFIFSNGAFYSLMAVLLTRTFFAGPLCLLLFLFRLPVGLLCFPAAAFVSAIFDVSTLLELFPNCLYTLGFFVFFFFFRLHTPPLNFFFPPLDLCFTCVSPKSSGIPVFGFFLTESAPM